MKNTRLTVMIEGAIIAGVCVALSFIPLNTANAAFDISLGLIPLSVYALRRGALPGLGVGLIWGLLLIVLGKAYFLAIPQVLLEYPIAFAFGGLGGLYAGRLRGALQSETPAGRPRSARAAVLYVILAAVTAALARWFFHFWAGVIFWGSYAPAGTSPYLYSFVLNGASAAANAILLAIVLPVLLKTTPPLFKT